MLSFRGADADITEALVRAAVEDRRAARSGAIVARHERRAVTGSEHLRPLHARLAALHRQIQRRHATTAVLHRTHAKRLSRRALLPPRFFSSVAATLGARQVGLTLLGLDRAEESTVATDPVAAAAQELEFTVGEGPAHDAAARRELVVAGETAFPRRWSYYSPAVARLGVRSVAAAPLCLNGSCLGVLTMFNHGRITALGTVADALVHTFLLVPGGPDPTNVQLLAGSDHRESVHQAAGMISGQLGCDAGDALALLRARAFADDVPVSVLADQVVERQVTFA